MKGLLLAFLALAGAWFPAHAEPTTTYPVQGVLRAFDSTSGEATISHDAIAHYMPAMTMAYRVRAPEEMAALRPGDTIRFQLRVTANDAWIDQVRRIGRSDVPDLAPAPVTAVRELNPGDPLPDVELINEHGKKFHVSDLRGQVIALTFIYTRCPLPTYCPLTTNNFQGAQKLLAQLGLPDGWHFLSISLDPAHDTPEVLATTLQNREADESRWTYATGDAAAVSRFGKSVGLEFTTAPNGSISHNLRTVVVDASGKITHIFRGNTWTPQELAAEVRSALRHRP